MRLRDFIRADSILCGFRSKSRDDTIELFAQTLASRNLIQNESQVCDCLTVTENVHTTVIGNGVAVPNASMEGLDKTLLMVAVSLEPVAFGPADVEGCSVFFVLLSPPNRGGEHIRLLARIARLASDPTSVDRFRTAASEKALLEALEAMDDRP